MGKYCTYCGRELKENEKCECKNKKVSQSKNNNLENFFKLLINSLKRPKSMMKIFISNNDYKYAIILILIESLFLSLISMMSMVRINYSISIFGLYLTNKSIIYAFTQFISLSVTALLFALYLKIFIDSICSKKVSLKQTICVVGAKSIGVLPFAVVGLIVSFFYPTWGSSLVNLGEILGYFFAYFAFKNLIDEDKDASIYALFLAIICQIGTKSILSIGADMMYYGNNLFF